MATMQAPGVALQTDTPTVPKKQISGAVQIPFPSCFLAQSDNDLSSRFRASYDQLKSLPRRALQRQLAKSTAPLDLSGELQCQKTGRSLRHKLAWSLAGAALLLALGQSVQAATITVNTKKPEILADGLCSLSEAIVNANTDAATHIDCAAGSGADIIQLPRGTHSVTTIYGSYALPTITSEITIEGSGAKIVRSIKAAPVSVIGTSVSGDLILNNLTVSGGSSFYSGGGIVNYGTLTLNYSNVSKNSATVSGGGIANGGTLTVLNSKIEKNKASYGGGIADNGGVTIVQDSSVSKNTAIRGGGVYSVPNSGSNVTITNSTITSNTAHQPLYGYDRANGGGVFNGYGNAITIDSSVISKNKASAAFTDGIAGGIQNDDGTLTVTNSTITGNKADFGGGIFSAGNTTIENSTISKNAAVDYPAGNGGGIGWFYGYTRGVLTVTNSTISSNKAPSGGGLSFGGGTVTINNSTITKNQAVWGGGIAFPIGGSNLILNSTLISGNKIKASGSGREFYIYGYGTVTADNYNLFGFNGDAGVVGFVPGATDIVPPLGVKSNKILSGQLKDNGGPPTANGKANSTHALVPGSPAVDAAPCVLETDQRGVARPQGLSCDIGAFELGP